MCIRDRFILLEELHPFVNYSISVRVYTSVGNGPYNDVVVEATQEDCKPILYIHLSSGPNFCCCYDVIMINFIFTAPVNSPQNVTVMLLSSTSINVTWEEVPPIDRNGIIIMYEVLYEPLETETFGQLSSDTGNTTDLFILLEELHPFVNYSISVRAYTSVGNGPYSDVVVEATQEDCKPIRYLHLSSNLNFCLLLFCCHSDQLYLYSSH